MQIKDESMVEPAFLCPDIADVARQFQIGCIHMEVAIQKFQRDVEAMVAVRGRLELLVPLYRNAVLSHQAANVAISDNKAKILHLFGHTGPAVAAERQAKPVADVGQQYHERSLSSTGRAGTPGAVTSQADVHNFAQAVHRDDVVVFFNEDKLICFSPQRTP